jgi:colanic acid biosynthesis glycosyl transferase WcaI
LKILIYGINFSPELTGIGKYTGELAFWLAEHGHEVRVITAPPYYPAWKLDKSFSNWWTSKLEFGNRKTFNLGLNLGSLLIYRCPLWVPCNPGGVKRLVHLASFAIASFPVILRQIFWRPDLVYVVEPPLFCAPIALVFAWFSNAKAWLHVQDFEVDAAFNLGMLRGKFLHSLVSWVESKLMHSFDLVSTISNRMLQRLLDKGLPLNKTFFAPNWVNVSDFSSLAPAARAPYRKQLAISNESIVALYSGNMGRKQGLELLGEVAKILLSASSPIDLVFVFCGDGAGREDLVACCNGFANVRFLGLQPKESLPDLLSMADIHLLPQRSGAADLVMPSKLTGIFASGRPVLVCANDGTELAEVVNKRGLVVPPEDVTAFCTALVMLANNVALREKFGSAAREYAFKNLDKNLVLAKIESEMRNLTGC